MSPPDSGLLMASSVMKSSQNTRRFFPVSALCALIRNLALLKIASQPMVSAFSALRFSARFPVLRRFPRSPDPGPGLNWTGWENRFRPREKRPFCLSNGCRCPRRFHPIQFLTSVFPPRKIFDYPGVRNAQSGSRVAAGSCSRVALQGRAATCSSAAACDFRDFRDFTPKYLAKSSVCAFARRLSMHENGTRAIVSAGIKNLQKASAHGFRVPRPAISGISRISLENTSQNAMFALLPAGNNPETCSLCQWISRTQPRKRHVISSQKL